MIYDCFNFFNELDILEIRLNTLSDVVDKFIICEATVTHTNQPKPLYYELNKKRFKKFKDRIIHTVIKDSPDVTTPWIIINHQMSEVTRDLKKLHPKPNDTILISSVDEIPNPEKILEYKDRPEKHKVFMQIHSNYFLNCVDYKNYGKWEGARMFKYKDLITYKTPYIARFTKPDLRIPNGGWHFSWIGDIKYIRFKMESMAHQEYNNDAFNTPEHIKKSISEGKDFLNHGLKFKIYDYSILPKYVQDNSEMYQHILIQKFDNKSFIYPIKSKLLNIKEKLRIEFRKARRTIFRTDM